MDQENNYFKCLEVFVKSNDSKFESQHALYSTAKPGNSVLSIHHTSVLNYLDVAIEQKHLLIDLETFYICDISKESSTPFNTLAFQLNGTPLKTKETTTQVMKRYFDYINVDYRIVSRFGKALGISRQCPYVVGSLYFLPERGATKNHVNWIALHHVSDVKPLDKDTYFNIESHHELTVKLSYAKALSLFHQTKLLIDSQDKMISECLEMIRYHTDPNAKPNFMTRLASNRIFSTTVPPLSSWLMTLMYLGSRELLNQAFKESNPLLDQVEETLEDSDDSYLA